MRPLRAVAIRTKNLNPYRAKSGRINQDVFCGELMEAADFTGLAKGFSAYPFVCIGV
jgi:hypothetical protein